MYPKEDLIVYRMGRARETLEEAQLSGLDLETAQRFIDCMDNLLQGSNS